MEKLIYQKKNEFNIKYFFYDISSHKFILWKLNIKFEKLTNPLETFNFTNCTFDPQIPGIMESWA